MSASFTITSAAFLVPLAFIISYYDICYRRIPNPFVLATLVVGFFPNTMLHLLRPTFPAAIASNQP